ncbi:dihydrofolate reductase family protein [Salipaludibacillus sp. LMS25]|jgi:dihydrofolate reductase|uniref:dihydrofolate reductase family protein n=1 Tax=Salipaludibacillus sp. LMS25 TaxID=2924031 RepID=UPI0020D1F26A|nr:dihydrofolate reductase family protein [Salipaludibacillus sp. LMS25]UTR13229.1 dihydrofolate reductase family protein [Salipaludibacillus sp. LMS25]
MGKVVVDMSMSLDGFIAGVNDSQKEPLGGGGAALQHWLFNGQLESRHSSFFKMNPISREVFDKSVDATGAILTGRRTYNVVGGWGGNHPAGVPVVILTHQPPEAAPEGDTPISFVTDGIESAVRKAKARAEGKNVGVAGARIVQQCLRAGLVDELHIHHIPILLGKGIRLFTSLSERIPLTVKETISDGDVTHILYSVERVGRVSD